MKRLSLWVLCFSLVLFSGVLAYAQTTGGVVAASAVPISWLSGLGMVLGLVLGYLNHGIASGTILIFGVPKPWMPYLSMLAVFLTAFVPQFEAMTAFSGNGLFLAIFAGISALVSYNAGATVRDHTEMGSDTRAATKPPVIKGA